MRYVIQYLLPIALLITVVYLVSRGRYSTSESPSDQRTFLIILAIGSAVAALLGFLFYQYMES